MSSIRFDNLPGLLYLLLPVLLLTYYFISSRVIKKGVFLSEISSLKRDFSYKILFHYLSVVLLFLGLFLIAFSLSKPQSGAKREITQYSGIDIMLVLDVSPSMLTKDYGNYTRLDVAKLVTSNFVDKRHGDRLGLVTFSTNSFLKAPATNNYKLLKDILSRIFISPEKQGSTSIGLGLASGVNRLLSIKDNLENQSKIIILITDGENNSGEITPQTATEIAKKSAIKIYTIGIGTAEELDMSLLKNIAEQTSGEFFFARNSNEIKTTFDTIDTLEKQTLNTIEFTNFKNIGYIISIFGIIFFLCGLFLYTFIFRRLG
ncbi:MAG: hypothetical protein A2015_06955 [Spirochaetes bacterium GWF1_31_7]|nr:MAG: hypothetical protein A2Y30_09505 [Spirochaetes bacterium GWE1_32_154]OHD46568.1 MAG: hypothetical protein A2015_06955 [Spirochaetes bacterium GWF1_31_7]OHD49377.1 MAG: hypothetical protein A2Y29_03950 [Spirochaetes bacterium GWE2_31_10]